MVVGVAHVPPSMKVTLPVGVPLLLVTVAVKVTDCPEVEGLSEEVKVVDVGFAGALDKSLTGVSNANIMSTQTVATTADRLMAPFWSRIGQSARWRMLSTIRDLVILIRL